MANRMAQALFVLLSEAVAMGHAAQPTAISVVSGNYQFGAAISGPSVPFQPLKVRVVGESGAPVADAVVTFAFSSPRGDIAITGGPILVARTDDQGVATIATFQLTAGEGFFNITANTVPALEKPAVFLLSQYAHVTCGVPVPPGQSETVMDSSLNPAPAGSPIELRATARLANDAGPVYFGDIAFTDSDRIIASETITNAVPSRVSVSLTLPGGSHFLRARLLETCSYRTSVSAPLIQTVTSGVRPLVNYSDMWWKASESGWGMSVIQHASGQMFVVWYHYREDGSPQWLVIPGGVWTTTTTFTGAMYRTSGPAYNGVFDPSRVSVVPVGVATLSFGDANSGIFTWSMDGVQGLRSITRQPF